MKQDLKEVVDFEGRSPLLGSSAISSHLRELGYPEESIFSMNKCQEATGVYYMSYCDCGASNGIHSLKHWCNLRTCEFCSKKRQRRVRRRYFKFLDDLSKNRLNSLYFLTISPRNYKNLFVGLKDIRKNFIKFLRLKYIKERIRGSIYVIEAKQKEDSWNIHIHAIVYGRFLDNRIRGKCLDCSQSLLKYDYQGKKYYCASHKCNSVNVVVRQDSRLVTLWKKSSKGQDVNMHVTRQGDAMYTLNYMLKYISASKEDFNDLRGMAEYIVATRKMKLISTTGCFFSNLPQISKPVCHICKTQVSFISCFDIEPQLRRAKKEAELVGHRKRINRKPYVPPPPSVIYVDLDKFF